MSQLVNVVIGLLQIPIDLKRLSQQRHPDWLCISVFVQSTPEVKRHSLDPKAPSAHTVLLS